MSKQSLGVQVLNVLSKTDASLLSRAELAQGQGLEPHLWWTDDAPSDYPDAVPANYLRHMGLALTALTLPEVNGMRPTVDFERRRVTIEQTIMAMFDAYTDNPIFCPEPAVGSVVLGKTSNTARGFLDTAVWVFTGLLYAEVWARTCKGYRLPDEVATASASTMKAALNFMTQSHDNSEGGGGWFWTLTNPAQYATSFLYYTSIAVDSLVDIVQASRNKRFLDVFDLERREFDEDFRDDLAKVKRYIQDAVAWIQTEYGLQANRSITKELLSFPEEDEFLADGDAGFKQGRSAYNNLWALLVLVQAADDAEIDMPTLDKAVDVLLESLKFARDGGGKSSWRKLATEQTGWAPEFRIGIFANDMTVPVKKNKSPRDVTILPLAIKDLSLYASMPGIDARRKAQIVNFVVGQEGRTGDQGGLLEYLVGDRLTDFTWPGPDQKFSVDYTERAIEGLYRVWTIASDLEPSDRLARALGDTAGAAPLAPGESAAAGSSELASMADSLARIAAGLGPIEDRVVEALVEAISEQAGQALVASILGQLQDPSTELHKAVVHAAVHEMTATLQTDLAGQAVPELFEPITAEVKKSTAEGKNNLKAAVLALLRRGTSLAEWVGGDVFEYMAEAPSDFARLTDRPMKAQAERMTDA